MATRKIAEDIWIVEKVSAKKVAYAGMIRQLKNGDYVAAVEGRVFGPFQSLLGAKEFFFEV